MVPQSAARCMFSAGSHSLNLQGRHLLLRFNTATSSLFHWQPIGANLALRPLCASLCSAYSVTAIAEPKSVEVASAASLAVIEKTPKHVTASLKSPKGSKRGGRKWEARVFYDKEHPIDCSRIPRYVWQVIKSLTSAGYDAYLVGGSVRDLYLGRTPKDFDVLTTAGPNQTKRLFGKKAMVVGRRFRICHVRFGDFCVEVSSFSTDTKEVDKRASAAAEAAGEWMAGQSPPVLHGKRSKWNDRDTSRWQNSLKRDFTINGLFLQPMYKILYDYVGGVSDLQKRKVRTILPAPLSLEEDPARCLRALRIAARLRFSVDEKISTALRSAALRESIFSLSRSRVMLEMNIMLAHGAAEPSLQLLWQFHLLDSLFPFQAEYFMETKYARKKNQKSNFLLDLMHTLDKTVSVDRPCDGSLWLSLLAFQLAAHGMAAHPVVIATAAIATRHDFSFLRASRLAQKIHHQSYQGERDLGSKAQLEVEDSVGLVGNEGRIGGNMAGGGERGEGMDARGEEELLGSKVEMFQEGVDGEEEKERGEGRPLLPGPVMKQEPSDVGGIIQKSSAEIAEEARVLIGLAWMKVDHMTDEGILSQKVASISKHSSQGMVLVPKNVTATARSLFRRKHHGPVEATYHEERLRTEEFRMLPLDFARIVLNTLYPTMKVVDGM